MYVWAWLSVQADMPVLFFKPAAITTSVFAGIATVDGGLVKVVEPPELSLDAMSPFVVPDSAVTPASAGEAARENAVRSATRRFMAVTYRSR